MNKNISEKLKIAINGRFLSREMTGVDRFAAETVFAMDALLSQSCAWSSKVAIQLIAPKDVSVDMPLRNISVTKGGLFRGQLWEQFDLPRLSRGKLLVNLCNTGPVARKNQFVVIHDIATRRVPSSYSARFRFLYHFLIPFLYRRARHVGTVSEFSKTELIREFGDRTSLVRLPEGVDHIERAIPDFGVMDKFGLGLRPYVLAVSSLAGHKNFRIIPEAIRVIGDTGFDVVIVGGKNASVFGGEAHLPSCVKHVGYVSDQELKALYSGASCFVFPSLYEGYGLPPTEAMAVGCPVVASRAAAIPETCGDSALYFEPNSAASLADAVRSVMTDSGVREGLRSRGLTRASSLKWSHTAVGILSHICAN